MQSIQPLRIRVVLVLFLSLLTGTGVSANEQGRFLGAEESEPPAWFKESFLDFEEDVREAAANHKRVMLYFHQANCPYCSLLVKENFTRPDIVAAMRKNLESIAVNLWGDREVIATDGKTYTEKSLAAALKVNYTPTLIFLDEQGKVALRLDGYYPPERFRLALDYVAGHKETELGFHAYLAARLAEAKTGGLHTEPFFLPPPYALARNGVSADRPLAVFFEQVNCRTATDCMSRSSPIRPPARWSNASKPCSSTWRRIPRSSHRPEYAPPQAPGPGNSTWGMPRPSSFSTGRARRSCASTPSSRPSTSSPYSTMSCRRPT